MKRNLLVFLFSLALLCGFAPAACADVGPKPSVQIQFEQMDDSLCYATLLSLTPSTGPSSVWDGDENHIWNYNLDLEIWRAFAEYQDPDGFYFLQEGWQVNETKSFAWTYYPPRTFKVLLYYPETGEFRSSGIYERYAFDSYYTIDLGSPGPELLLRKSYDYTWEVISLLARIALTLLIEMALALVFRFRSKQLLFLIGKANLVTQVSLNLLLSFIDYNQGSMAFVFFYLLLELGVFVLETVYYLRAFPRAVSVPIRRGKIIFYALAANALSFAGGMWIAVRIPGIF